MEVSERESLLREIRPYVKEMIEEIVAESFKKGEMKDLFEDLVLAKTMEETEQEGNLSRKESLQQLEWK